MSDDGFKDAPGAYAEDGWDDAGSEAADNPPEESNEDAVLEEEVSDMEGVDDIPSEEAITSDEEEAIADVSGATSRRDKRDRAGHRIKQLSDQRREAAALAQHERDQRIALEKKLAELQKTSHTSTVSQLEAQEKSLKARLKQATDDNDMASVVSVMEELSDVKAQRYAISQRSPADPPAEVTTRTVYDELWIRANPSWDSDPKEAKLVMSAWKEVSEQFTPGTAAFYEALDERREELRSSLATKPTPSPTRKPAGPPVAGRTHRTSTTPGKGRQLPKEAIESAKRMGKNPNDPIIRRELMKIWGTK